MALVYVAMLAVATRAVIPEGTGYSDAIYYHLAYAQDWANAGRLVVDPFMAFIFYANNFLLFFTAWIVLRAGAFVQFLRGRLDCSGRLGSTLPSKIAPAPSASAAGPSRSAPRRRCARFDADFPRLFRIGLHRRADRRDGVALGRRNADRHPRVAGRIG